MTFVSQLASMFQTRLTQLFMKSQQSASATLLACRPNCIDESRPYIALTLVVAKQIWSKEVGQGWYLVISQGFTPPLPFLIKSIALLKEMWRSRHWRCNSWQLALNMFCSIFMRYWQSMSPKLQAYYPTIERVLDGSVKPFPIAIPFNPFRNPLFSLAYFKIFSPIAGAYFPPQPYPKINKGLSALIPIFLKHPTGFKYNSFNPSQKSFAISFILVTYALAKLGSAQLNPVPTGWSTKMMLQSFTQEQLLRTTSKVLRPLVFSQKGPSQKKFPCWLEVPGPPFSQRMVGISFSLLCYVCYLPQKMKARADWPLPTLRYPESTVPSQLYGALFRSTSLHFVSTFRQQFRNYYNMPSVISMPWRYYTLGEVQIEQANMTKTHRITRLTIGQIQARQINYNNGD